MKTLMLVLCLGVVWPAQADTYPKNPNIDIQHYAFALALSDSSDVIHGTATITAHFKTAGQSTLRLDLINAADSLDGKGMTVRTVHHNGQPLRYTHTGDVLLITLPAPSRAGQHMTVVVGYGGIPASGFKIAPNKYGDRTFFSDNWPNRARHWLPAVDHPYDKATCEFIVTAPARYQVASNGLLQEETDLPGGFRRTHWKQSVPISVWLYALAVAEFAVQYVDTFDGKSIQTWVYPQDRDAGFYDFAVPTKHTLQFYTDYVGPYAYEKLANIQSNSVGGGMEAATAIFYGDKSVTGNRSERWRNVIIHEVAHQWFGNAVTEYDWDDVWLSEGFATYFTLLFIEHAYGRDAFVDGLRSARDRVYRYYQDHPHYRIVHDNLADMRQVASSQTYQKGAWVLHMLRTHVGDEAFQAGIQAYYKAHFNAHATTADFLRAMETASGQELDGFFKQWLYQGGNVVVDGTWHYDAEQKRVHVTLAQVQTDGHAFTVPVEIGLYQTGQAVPTVEAVTLADAPVQVSFPAATRPARVDLDPRTVLLAQWTFREQPE